ncbi:MAG: hypothetical protein CBE19_02525 [Pelagibacteraceae bacterium TMED259]|nr:MAG: hypothetical protein CBE19_02525 [Pelagibacteraceae bacterium TMED259]
MLFLKNTALQENTIGQDFELKQEQRFLVISGPNAGGKSITLKTIGLLQLMFQSGLMVSVNDVSEFCWFDTILSDIGDNQSIENQLSTYSYRLARMELFLNKVNGTNYIFLYIGLLGSFTTLSSFNIDMFNLLSDRLFIKAFIFFLLNIVLSFIFFYLFYLISIKLEN